VSKIHVSKGKEQRLKLTFIIIQSCPLKSFKESFLSSWNESVLVEFQRWRQRKICVVSLSRSAHKKCGGEEDE